MLAERVKGRRGRPDFGVGCDRKIEAKVRGLLKSQGSLLRSRRHTEWLLGDDPEHSLEYQEILDAIELALGEHVTNVVALRRKLKQNPD
jgi:hypothetical protein